MVQLGKVYGNRMVDVAVTNKKLRDRALRILQDLTGLPRPAAVNTGAKWQLGQVGSACIDGFEPRGRRSPFGRT